MNLADLPSELLIDIVEYLRPDETNKPITGINAAYKQFVISPRSVTNEQESQTEHTKPLSPYASLYALAATCSIFKELCSRLIYKDLDLMQPITRFDDFYSGTLVPNAVHVRHIRIARGVVTDAEATKTIERCLKAKSVALYGERSNVTPSDTADNDGLDGVIIKLFEQASLDTLGIYHAGMMGKWRDHPSPLTLLRQLAQSTKGSVALKHLDLSFKPVDPELSYLIRTSFPSLESLTCFGFLGRQHPNIWNPTGDYNWAQYTNLTRLQFRDGSPVYSSQISYLVRHFPSLKHLLVSFCDNGDLKADNVRPNEWYKRKDALWRVREPLDTFHLEHMDEDEVMVMGDIPTRTLIIANLRGDQLTMPMRQDPNLFPGLRYIRIQPPVIPEYDDGAHPFNERTLLDLQEICRRRGIILSRDAEATRLLSRHRY